MGARSIYGSRSISGSKGTLKIDPISDDAEIQDPHSEPHAGSYDSRGIYASREAPKVDPISEYKSIYEPAVKEYARLMERDALSAFQREKAMALQALGYRQSAGSGDSGLYQSAELALDRAATQKAGEIATIAEKFERAAFLSYMEREDQQAFQLEAMKYQYEYQMKIAEQNSSSWWEGLASLGGLYLGFKMAAAPATGGASLVY